MMKPKNYRKTLIACYLGFITQAISANFTPLLFLTFKDTYGISLEKIALIPMVFYLTQLLVDLGATVSPAMVGGSRFSFVSANRKGSFQLPFFV